MSVCLILPAPIWAQEELSHDTAQSKPTREKIEVVALKNNLVYDAILTPNLEIEFRLAPKWSMELGAAFNPFPLDDTKFPKWRHVSAWIAPRYWFCNVFNRGFLSFNVAYAHYNVAGNAWPVSWMYKQVKESRYQGDAVMAGVSYGWHFAISPHFSVELEGGVDAGYTWYDQFECKHCGAKKDHGGRWFVLPKIGVNLSVPLGGDKLSLARRCDCEQIDDKPEEAAPDTTPVVVEPIVEEEPVERLDVARIVVPIVGTAAPVIASVPFFEPKVDNMQRLRSRLLRSEETYEPYDQNMALSADPRNVFLYFEVNVTKMDRSFIQNDMLMDSIMQILGNVVADSTIRVSHVQIVGFASFDGRQAYNHRLAGSRAQTIKEYMQSVYPLPDSVFAVCNGGESWAELRYRLVQLTHNTERVTEEQVEMINEVIAIMDTEPDADLREKQIKELRTGETYRYLRDELQDIMRNLGCITIYIETVE